MTEAEKTLHQLLASTKEYIKPDQQVFFSLLVVMSGIALQLEAIREALEHIAGKQMEETHNGHRST